MVSCASVQAVGVTASTDSSLNLEIKRIFTRSERLICGIVMREANGRCVSDVQERQNTAEAARQFLRHREDHEGGTCEQNKYKLNKSHYKTYKRVLPILNSK
eukprot:4918091-Amphidinium_carterae.1